MDERILFLVNTSAHGVIEMVTNNLHSKCEDGEEITKEEIEAMVESSVSLTLSEEEWHIKQALLETVNNDINIDNLLKEYGQTDSEE